jgi:hypothetical protein
MTWPDENVKNLRGGVCNIPVPYWEDKREAHIEWVIYKESHEC